jgi:RNA polymerase sigma factor (sigma-70 family)
MNVDELVGRAVAGDPAALEALLREAAPRLRQGLAVDARFQREFDVDDILQVTFVEAFLRIRSLQQANLVSFTSWLRRIAEHNLADAVRASTRKKRDGAARITHGPAGESSRTLLQAVAGEQTTAGSRASIEEQLTRLQRAIAELPSSYRTVVEQLDLAERSVAEVALALQRSEGAVHMLRARAHDRLRELLHEPGRPD